MPDPTGPTGPEDETGGQRRVQDLGFFTGSTAADSQTFGSSEQFGSAPHGLYPQFGDAGQIGAPPSSPAPPPLMGFWSGRRRVLVRRIGVPLVVLGVLFGAGRLSGLQSFFAGDLQAPTTLGGQPRLTDASTAALERDAEAKLEDENPGDGVIATYGDDGYLYLLLIAQRTKVDIDEEFSDAGLAGRRQDVGDSTCVGETGGGSMCIRTESGLSVAVIGTTGMDAVAAAVEEFWSDH